MKARGLKVLFLTGVVVVIFGMAGCSLFQKPHTTHKWIHLIESLLDVEAIARLDALPTRIVTSVDPTGSNDDFNHPVRRHSDGWFVLADLKGPGYVSRFWMTGPKDGVHGLRFYFDGEKTPRIDTTVGEWCGGKEPFLPPVAIHESYGWYSYVPIPYKKRLIIMVEPGGTEAGGWPRIFHQVNYQQFPKGETIESMPAEPSADIAAALANVRKQWDENTYSQPGEKRSESFKLTLNAGARGELARFEGPGIMRELKIRPDWDSIEDPIQREEALQDVILNITWDDAETPSVQVPLSEFFGSFWRPTRFGSMYVGMDDDTFYTRFPMPFEKRARIAFQNRGSIPVTLSVEGTVRPTEVMDPDLGFFHATWQSTSPREVGRPHPIVRAKGRGRFAGCFLSVVSLDKSWWILEGDETIRVDDEGTAGWKGTGLEDYFNGAWYYQNVVDHPFNGLTFKAPFRTVQYRLHQPDPVLFNKSIDVLFERGPDQASHGWMESVGYYYLDSPQDAGSRLAAKRAQQRPQDPLAKGTMMCEMINLERAGDYPSCVRYIDAYLARNPEFPFASVLKLRKLAYKEREQGFEATKADYEAFLGSETNELARAQAENILWFHEDPSHALLSLFCNTPTRAMLDGKIVHQAGHPERMDVIRVEVEPGRHALALQAKWKQYPDWVQAHLRTHSGDIFTTPDWKFAFDARGGWMNTGFADSMWKIVGGTGVKGPPEVPHVWVEPNAYVDVQAEAVGLRPGPRDVWPNKQGYVVYRKEFDTQ